MSRSGASSMSCARRSPSWRSGSACDLELEDIARHPELESAWLAGIPSLHEASAPVFVEAGR